MHTGKQHLVRRSERFKHRNTAVANSKQAVVRHHDEGIDLFLQCRDTVLSLFCATSALKGERLGDNTDRERTDRLRNPRDDRSTTGTGTATLTGGDEHHIGTGKCFFDLLDVIFCRTSTNLWVGSGAKAASEFTPHIELDVGVGHQQRLRISIDCNEFNAAQTDFDHAVHSVDTTATNTDDLNYGEVVVRG